MTAVTNKGASPVGFPGGEHADPGATVDVLDWEKQSKRVMYAALVASGVLVPEVPEVAEPVASPPLPKRK